MAAQLHAQIPTDNRTAFGSVNIPPVVFPKIVSAPSPDLDVSGAATTTVNALNEALKKGDYEAAAKLFVDQGYWRDHLALTWEFRTAQGTQGITSLLQDSSKSKDGFRLKEITIDSSSALRAPKVASLDGEGEVPGIQFFINFVTVIGSGKGVARLVDDSGTWKFFSIYTALDEIDGHQEQLGERRPKGVKHGQKRGPQNWAEKRQQETSYQNGTQPAVLIIGAGQAGLTAAARLKMIGVDALIIEQNNRVGDNWRKRYHNLVLHDTVWYQHLPYIPFPPQWPIFTPKDKLATFFEAYATLLELNVWTKTELGDVKWDDATGSWSVTVQRQKEDGTTETRTLHPHHIIQATGLSGFKFVPKLKGMENFKGDRICHSSDFPGSTPNSTGKKAVIVGCCTSAHDIAQDFVENGYDVTLVQRSSTFVASSKSVSDILLRDFSEGGPPIEDLDLLFHSQPTAVLKALHTSSAKKQTEHDRETLEGLRKVGFNVDSGPDGAGLLFKYFQLGGRYYIDVGASKLIVDGKIKVKQGQEIAEVLPHGLRFEDGSELEADEIVLATGYGNMRDKTRHMLGDAVADKIGDVWGFGEGGELRNIFQQTGHPGFWIHGSSLALCRYYSKALSLQIKGIEEGLYKYGEK
ncbi:hypothetical protein ACSS6W_000269 [Trichoderma asperelloides]